MAAGLAVTDAAAGELRLVMFERDGCIYCARWHEQIGPAYPNTAEGAAAPLLQVNIKDPLPDTVTLTGGPPVITPTFVLTDDGAEVARMAGYPGDEFFWVLLDDMLEQAGWTEAAAQATGDSTPPAPAPPPAN